ncbi:hypothetical protein F5880DRAFT_1592663 [Lentinula raphanica]|nr:hypothetical protein F5880DRAFT_1592663 [Lentinula raphanica]
MTSRTGVTVVRLIIGSHTTYVLSMGSDPENVRRLAHMPLFGEVTNHIRNNSNDEGGAMKLSMTMVVTCVSGCELILTIVVLCEYMRI